MSNNTENNPQKEKGSAIESPITRDEINRDEIMRIYAVYISAPDADKCEMLKIPFDVKLKKYESRPTDIKFAAMHGVHRDTLYNWRKREDFRKTVDKTGKDWGMALLPNVMASLYRTCIKYGRAYDVELFLAYYADWDRKQVIKHVHEKFDVDDLRAIIDELPDEEKENAYEQLGNIITRAELYRSNKEVS